MVDIAQRLCTAPQAKFFAAHGMKQLTQYGWQPATADPYGLVFCPDKDTGFPIVIDWSEDKDTYAAFDNTDLGLMLASLGFYPAGPTFPLEQNENVHFRWWCDDICTFNNIEDTVYQAYGQTEAEAKAAMLMKLIDTGKVPLRWEYYDPKRIKQLKKFGKIYGNKPSTDSAGNPEDTF